MAGKRLFALLLVGVSAAAITLETAYGASAPGIPAAAAMTLTAADLPGATVAKQGVFATKDPDVANAYQREFEFKTPYGTSKYIQVVSEVLVTTSVDNAATEYRIAGHSFSTPAYQRAIAKEVVSGAAAKDVLSVSKITPRALGFGDSALEIGLIVHLKQKLTMDVSLSLYRVGKVVVLNVAIGRGSKINAADARKLGELGLAHIDAALDPDRDLGTDGDRHGAAGPDTHGDQRQLGRRARLVRLPVAALRRERGELHRRRRRHRARPMRSPQPTSASRYGSM